MFNGIEITAPLKMPIEEFTLFTTPVLKYLILADKLQCLPV